MSKHSTVLVVGQGGREHALAWKLAQSPQVARVLVAPGNGGTARAGGKIANVPFPANGFAGLAGLARREGVSLAVVGPEVPLADGIVDAFAAAGLRCFGPSRAAAQIEASKAFAKAFMVHHGIPTARYAVFTDLQAALEHLRRLDYPVVIKASGLAAGKGVIVPESPAEAEAALRLVLEAREFGAAGDEVLVEERLAGPEASVMAFCDGRHVAVMPPAQDHKRALDGDQGPNTGGMGAYAPAPLVTPALLEEIHRTVLQPTVAGLAASGVPYVGVLYAGIMLTAHGPQVLEFNCRFGDPEAQAILPLLDSDLADVCDACLDGRLGEIAIRWRAGSAATVVAAAEGYPGSYARGQKISGVDRAATLPGVAVFHAGTALAAEGRLLTDGGRVLAVTGTAADLAAALRLAYTALEQIHFPGMHFRRDIGRQAVVDT